MVEGALTHLEERSSPSNPIDNKALSSLKVIRDLTPDLFATDFHYHGLTCSYSVRPVLQLPSIPGASASRI